MDKLSLIIPCYNEAPALDAFYAEASQVCGALPDIETSFFFVDDGSCDATLSKLRALAQVDERVHYLSFSRNFGKEAAMLAGLCAADGDYLAVMDADLQDPPSLLPEMLSTLRAGIAAAASRPDAAPPFDCVATRRVNRKGEPPIRSFFARMFYKIINKISKTEIVDGARDFRLMTRRMADAILSVQEYNRFSKGIFSWVGFSTKWLEYVNMARVAGESKWSFWKLLLYSLDGVTAFSTVPLLISALAGLLFCVAAFLLLIFVVVRAAIWGDPVSGWPSLVSIVLLASGAQLFCVGILGQYLAKTYLEVKHRPHYIVREQR